jgi:hypothetical protein
VGVEIGFITGAQACEALFVHFIQLVLDPEFILCENDLEIKAFLNLKKQCIKCFNKRFCCPYLIFNAVKNSHFNI